jgi:adenylate cyclase
MPGMHNSHRRRRGSGWTYLWKMLSEYNQFPEHGGAIQDALRTTFEQNVAMLVLDMSGFSRLTAQYGVLHYLAMIAQMVESATPAVTGNGGIVIKQEADNLFARFPTSADALEAATDIFRAFEVVNAVTPPERHIRGSIGIGYGSTLVVEDEDMFGNEMNVACKLGEDLARPGEILLTEAAREALPDGRYVFTPAEFQCSGMQIDAFRFVRKLFDDEPPAT